MLKLAAFRPSRPDSAMRGKSSVLATPIDDEAAASSRLAATMSGRRCNRCSGVPSGKAAKSVAGRDGVGAGADNSAMTTLDERRLGRRDAVSRVAFCLGYFSFGEAKAK